MIQLGDKVRDRITGFEGIVIGITDWLYQCRRPIVQPSSLHDGKPTESQSFDEDQLEIVERGAFRAKLQSEPDPIAKTGGPRDIPARRTDPRR